MENDSKTAGKIKTQITRSALKISTGPKSVEEISEKLERKL
jgi:hypothetical protein